MRQEHVPGPASDTSLGRISHFRSILKLIPILVHAFGFFEIQLERDYVKRGERVKFLRLGHTIVILVLPQPQPFKD